MHKKIIGTNILICSTQLPGNGGSATNAYNIHAILRELNVNSVCIFLEDISNEQKTQIIKKFNHYNLPKIYILSRKGEIGKVEFKNIMEKEFKSTNSIPEIAYCKNYSSPHIIREYLGINSDKTSIVYLVAGSKSYTEYLNTSQQKEKLGFYEHKKELEKNLESESYKSLIIKDSEFKSSISSDYINGNSVTCGESYMLYSNSQKLKSKYNGELYTSFTTYKILNDKIRKESMPDFDKRSIDVLFAVSSTKRKVKNSKFAISIFNDVRLKDMKKVIIGDYSTQYANEYKNIKSYEKLSNLEVLNYMNNAKILINTSYYEASPNTCIEALCLNCHVLTSVNCGSMNEILEDQDLLNLNNKDSWVDRIISIIKSNKNQQKFKKVEILKNFSSDILQKKMQINKNSFDFSSDFSLLSINYFFMNSIKYNIDVLKNINVTPDNAYIMIPDFRPQIDEKYAMQRLKFIKNIETLKNFNIITNSQLSNLLVKNKHSGEKVLFSDCEKITELPGAFRKICKSLGINQISKTSSETQKTLCYVYFKKPTLEKYKKIGFGGKGKYIDLSALIVPV